MFGAPKADDKPVAPLFGAPKADDKPAAPLFGAPKADAKPVSLFGTPKADDKPVAPLFGAPKSDAKPVSLFGDNKTEGTPPPLFGASKTSKADGKPAPLFGAPVEAEKKAAPLFALSSTTGTSLFATVQKSTENEEVDSNETDSNKSYSENTGDDALSEKTDDYEDGEEDECEYQDFLDDEDEPKLDEAAEGDAEKVENVASETIEQKPIFNQPTESSYEDNTKDKPKSAFSFSNPVKAQQDVNFAPDAKNDIAAPSKTTDAPKLSFSFGGPNGTGPSKSAFGAITKNDDEKPKSAFSFAPSIVKPDDATPVEKPKSAFSFGAVKPNSTLLAKEDECTPKPVFDKPKSTFSFAETTTKEDVSAPGSPKKSVEDAPVSPTRKDETPRISPTKKDETPPQFNPTKNDQTPQISPTKIAEIPDGSHATKDGVSPKSETPKSAFSFAPGLENTHSSNLERTVESGEKSITSNIEETKPDVKSGFSFGVSVMKEPVPQASFSFGNSPQNTEDAKAEADMAAESTNNPVDNDESIPIGITF